MSASYHHAQIPPPSASPIDRKEREKLLAVIARQGFEEDLYTHAEIFSDLDEPFTVKEAAEYLDVTEITVRRWVRQGSLKSRRIGRNIVFDPGVLRTFKRAWR